MTEPGGSLYEKVRLDGRTIIDFGAGGGGMGTHTALAIAGAGAHLIAVDLTEERVEATRTAVEAFGGRCDTAVADVRSLDELRRAFDLADEDGGADGLVNLVGGTKRLSAASPDKPTRTWMPIGETDESVYEDTALMNMSYVFYSCREFARRAVPAGRRGSIVNFASVSAVAGAPFHSPYGMAKAGVMSLTRSVAVELGPHGIRSNCIVPGSVPAPLSQAGQPAAFDNITDRASRKAPLGRRVAPDEIAGAVLFFLSDLSGGVTGQCLNVDAGASANSPLGTGPEYLETTNLRPR